jgi:hypothetical protein
VEDKNLSVINSPNSLGTACNFQAFSFYVGPHGTTFLGLPNFPNYNLGPMGIYNADAGKDTIICTNSAQSVQLGQEAEPGIVYQWQPAASLNDATIAQPVASPTEDTYYILTITDTSATTASCQLRMDTVFVKVETCTGIESGQQSGSEVKVYPNPANEQLLIEAPANNELLLYDLLGRLVRKQVLQEAKSMVDISSLPEGLYIYRIGDNGGYVTGKVQVVR